MAMKIVLTGRPGRFTENGNVIMTTMVQSTPPTLPKDLPPPGSGVTTYFIYISRKQWDQLENVENLPEDDMLIVEGHPYFDKELKAMSIFSTRVTTRITERTRTLAKLEQHQAKLKAQQEEEELSVDFDE